MHKINEQKVTIDITFDEDRGLSNNLCNVDYIWDLWARTDSNVWWSRLNLLNAIVYRITLAGRSPLFHPVRIWYQQGRGCSTIEFWERIPILHSHKLKYTMLPLLIHTCSDVLYRLHFSLCFFFSITSRMMAFYKPSWRTNADVTPLCGVPPAIGVTSGGGAERRKPIVASTRPNHLRFCGQAIHVPLSFSWYSLTARRDRDELGYRLLLSHNPRHRSHEAFMNNESLSKHEIS